MARLQFAAQKVHDDFVVAMVVEEVGPAQTADELEADTLIDALRRLVVIMHLHLDAVEIAEEEAVFADQACGLRSVSLPARLLLADPDKQRADQCTGDVGEAAKADQATARQLDHGELGAVGP